MIIEMDLQIIPTMAVQEVIDIIRAAEGPRRAAMHRGLYPGYFQEVS
jgi:hypothetical protein